MKQKLKNEISLTNCKIGILKHEQKQIMGYSKLDTSDGKNLSQHMWWNIQKLYQGQTEYLVVWVALQIKMYMDPRAAYWLLME